VAKAARRNHQHRHKNWALSKQWERLAVLRVSVYSAVTWFITNGALQLLASLNAAVQVINADSCMIPVSC
jgi:hypothetical protein